MCLCYNAGRCHWVPQHNAGYSDQKVEQDSTLSLVKVCILFRCQLQWKPNTAALLKINGKTYFHCNTRYGVNQVLRQTITKHWTFNLYAGKQYLQLLQREATSGTDLGVVSNSGAPDLWPQWSSNRAGSNTTGFSLTSLSPGHRNSN